MRKNKKLKLNKSTSVLYGLGNAATEPIGYINGTVRVDTVETLQNFVIVPDYTIKYNAVLGYDFINKFKFSSDANGYKFEDICEQIFVYNVSSTELDVPHKYQNIVDEIVSNYKAAESLERCPVEMQIIPDVNFKPFHHSPSRLPTNEQEEVKKQVQQWLVDGIVRTSKSSVASRVVVVKKKTNDYRVCIDYRQLNKMVLRDCFPVPLIDEVLEKLGRSKVFITMDLQNGFFHVPIQESSKYLTAFVTKEGLFEFNRAPFGFCNSPANFLRYVSLIFQPLINDDVMELYMDDIIIYAETADQCLYKLNVVLNTAAKYDLNIKWSKCSFLKNKIDFLGYQVEKGMIWPGKEKTKAIKCFPNPKNIRDVQSFLGITGYFRRFIEGYAHIARPLTELLKKDVPFKIKNTEMAAIAILKNALVQEPVLKIYERSTTTELHTDASKNGFGAVLLQFIDGQLNPVN